MSDYRRLKVWRHALDLIAKVYALTNSFPSHELYGLTSQIRRAATSIALNLAEGATSGYDPEYKRFLRLSIRSCNEVSAAFEIAERLTFCGKEDADKVKAECNEIAAMLQGLAKSLVLSETGELYTVQQFTPEETSHD
ncbi:MAG: four helix bundle protein [Chloroflexi bacterium]|nr:four helix bundle protein [Chloroflexota bacterium]